ncbi:peptidyl-prolyl cis-trans isomerase NIMA-interacting 1 [Candida albicans P57072]|uniref:Peptidyl-prolyl cis-trans isomerase n=4 Tax=Candida albicans TaxID=5476 RepID=Q59KZ2_CANAL|nr:peptidylprolyl isomerase [Candida albicans SC5314]1YW5_A Chain A, peptidyl prolyl cis/trans isomerase [Candida albicans]EEQ42732.1 peptidyl-prolyl cis-trans isomerase 1 [Candida albicans WO-1]KGQ91706.1 peptidyl-prolyl cis-trans isomerase NIMA-interacting 1 [Candida albicans P94015]KGQ98832.1 peptidyl-prolyl cis-trans isomerase NIMA-interacting 1 [Candida albicans P37005]KGR03649.1 peptidyl-prolyl cis-trans isomerase NIMA-interacting 1 [Candida albicans GC75]KGR15570.1 peptidyl-prolyl cis-|eukprot:XP_710404.1 peptidylprolyl isomerase [Candida albicans SC5314]
MASTSTGLPPNWTIRVSRSHNKEYFLNQSTNESSWDPPYGTDKEVLNAYIAKFKNNGYKPLVNEDGQVRVSHLLIKNNQSRKPKSWKSPDGISRTRDESIQILKKHLERILSGEVKLSELANTESDCSSHDRGGDLGFFSKGQMQPPFEEAAFNLHVGEVSNIIETNSGVHILQRTG